MTPSHFQMLLLAAASLGIAQTRHVPATVSANQQVTSSLGSGVASVEIQSILEHNNNYTSFAVEGANANLTQQSQSVLEQPRQTQLSLEDDFNDNAFTVYIRSPKSVVQDWSLVCQQLCGAGLGGPPCAAYCQSSEEPSLLPAFSVDQPNICKDLCSIQLGDVSCNCIADEATTTMPQNTTTISQYEWGNVVCSSFCEHSEATLTGCSTCIEGNAEVEISERTMVETTTPDWKELCIALCKTGDGGSLCNCDLAPFF